MTVDLTAFVLTFGGVMFTLGFIAGSTHATWRNGSND